MKIQMLGTLASTSASVWTSVTITFTTSRYKEQQKYLLKVFWICHLQAIHNFVEVLNEYFHNVCELDLVFNFYKVWKRSEKWDTQPLLQGLHSCGWDVPCWRDPWN